MFVVKSTVKFKPFSRCLSSFARFPASQLSHQLTAHNRSLCAHPLSSVPLWCQPAVGTPLLASGNAASSYAGGVGGGHNIVQVRWSSTDGHPSSYQQKRKRPMLMDFPHLVWPSVIKTIRNWIMVHFIIRPYFDKEFNLPDFVQGAKQALQESFYPAKAIEQMKSSLPVNPQIVSSSLAGGEIKHLNGLVDRVALNDIRHSLSKMSVAERYDIQVDKEDVYFSFPYQVGVMFDESDDDNQKRFVEITMVFHVLRGLKGMIERGESVPLNVGALPEFRDKISICNYRFIKEFTKGVDSDWTVNVVNHFKPNDYIED